MRRVLVGAAIVSSLALSAGVARANCNVMGQFCEQPNWASNAFAGTDQVPESTLPTNNAAPYFNTLPGPTMPPRYGATVYGSPVYVAPRDAPRRRYR